MKLRVALVLALLALLLHLPLPVVQAGGIDDPNGVPLYVIIEVTWDGDPAHDGSWTVHGPKWNPVPDGPILTSCPIGPLGTCLAMNYDFEFSGKTVHFVEHSVDSVHATPQDRHVVLKDLDGDGVYTGSLSAEHYFPWVSGSALVYFDRLDYDIRFNPDGSVAWFHYLQYEHKKLIP